MKKFSYILLIFIMLFTFIPAINASSYIVLNTNKYFRVVPGGDFVDGITDGDILVMCTDGVIDSNKEYVNKQLWLRYLLEDIEVNDAQKIADIIIGEAIDNDYGKQKDDMSVIVAKITKK